LAVLTYRWWDHYVGPDPYATWQFRLSPANMSLVLPLAVISPLLLWAAEGRGLGAKREAAASALSCFALSAALAALLSRHFFLLAGFFALASLCAAGAVLVRRKGERSFAAAALFPLGLSDLCLALGVLFIYLSDPSRGLFFPSAPLRLSGNLITACALMLAAALLRLGCFPFQRWMARISEGGKDLRLVHLLAVDLTLGAFLLYSVTRVFFAWEGAWIWICFGISALTLALALRGLLHAAARHEVWGLLAMALGAQIALCAAPGSQAAAAAMRLGLWAGIPALALVHIGSVKGKGRTWALILGAASLMGIPPMAGFAWRWMEFQALAGELSTGAGVLFIAAVALVFGGALIEGFASLWIPRVEGEGEASGEATIASGALLAAFLLAVGLYAGTFVDLLMREYGLPVSLPFPSWTSLGWAVLLSAGIAALILYTLNYRGRAEVRRETTFPGGPLPLRYGGRFPPGILNVPVSGRGFAVVILCDICVFAAWAAVMVYLALS
jgi:formate hydrogenlyase subunit 3/multisubunit Na+/H+ antiporter MnhD subunit